MTLTMWCIVNKKTGKIRQISTDDGFIIGYTIKTGLKWDTLKLDELCKSTEEIKKITFKY